METELKGEKELWYVMRVYKNEKKAEELLLGRGGLRYFIPKEQVSRVRHGKKVSCMVPVIPSLVFVRATRKQAVEFKKNIYNDLQFVIWRCDEGDHYLTVPDKQMEDFMQVCLQTQQKVTFYRPFPAICVRTSMERLMAIDKGVHIFAIFLRDSNKHRNLPPNS